ncbi:MAG TPA: envelope stress response membrane protein PspB [Solimonas sp.]|nr:envelope stress response membrane protein PspB [Solimonas sp.]
MEDIAEILVPLIAILSIFVVLPALILRHSERKRELELKHKDTVSGDILQLADRMEQRIEALERILDVEAPGWREKHHEQR